jgi:hypothetical protein
MPDADGCTADGCSTAGAGGAAGACVPERRTKAGGSVSGDAGAGYPRDSRLPANYQPAESR